MSLESDGRESDGLETCSREKDVAPRFYLNFFQVSDGLLKKNRISTISKVAKGCPSLLQVGEKLLPKAVKSSRKKPQKAKFCIKWSL